MATGTSLPRVDIANLVGKAIEIGDDCSDVKAYSASKREAAKYFLTAIKATRQATTLSGSDCITHLNNMKREYGRGVCTLIVVANGTGSDMSFNKPLDFHGHIWKYTPPRIIGPGQVGMFLHSGNSLSLHPVGSKGYIIYNVKYPPGVDTQEDSKMVALGFDTGIVPAIWHRRNVYVAFGEINISRHAMVPTFASDEQDGIELSASIGQNYCPICTFVVSYKPEIAKEKLHSLGRSMNYNNDNI